MTISRPILCLLALGAAACKRPLQFDASEAKYIPKAIAVEELGELLPTAEVIRCSEPRAVLGAGEIRSWAVTETGVEFAAEVDPKQGETTLGFAFADVTAVKLNRLHLWFEVRIHTPAEPREWKEHFRFGWKTEAPARRAAELIASLRAKAPPPAGSKTD